MSPHPKSWSLVIAAILGLCACATPPRNVVPIVAVPVVSVADVALEIQSGHAGEATHDERVGGLIKAGSRHLQGSDLTFVIFSRCCEVPVLYLNWKRTLVDPLQDGQGAFVTGRVQADGVFLAHKLYAGDGLSVDDIAFRADPK